MLVCHVGCLHPQERHGGLGGAGDLQEIVYFLIGPLRRVLLWLLKHRSFLPTNKLIDTEQISVHSARISLTRDVPGVAGVSASVFKTSRHLYLNSNLI
jgi:hypothetical protein